MKKSILSLLVFTSLLNANEMSLDEIIALGLSNSPDLNISRLDIESSQARISQVDSAYKPRVDVGAALGVQNVKFDGVDAVSSNVVSANITASQLIYDFGKTGGVSDDFTYQSDALKASLKQNISDKIFTVKRDYYSYQLQHTLIKVNEENVKLNESQLNRSQKYYNAGIRTKIDVSDANVRLIEAKLDLNNAQYDKRLAHVSLERTVGRLPTQKKIEVVIEHLDIETLYESLPLLKMSPDELEKFAYAHREELNVYRNQIKSEESKLKSYDGEYYPDIYLNANAQVQDPDGQPFLPKNAYGATINLNWNIYGGNETDAKTQESNIEISKAKVSLINFKLNIKEETDNAYIDILKSKDNVELTQSLSVAAKEKFFQSQKRYEHGLGDYIELQEARQGYIDALSKLVTSYYAYHVALAQLDRAIGK